MIALKSDGFRRLKDEIEGEGLKSEFRRLRDEVEGEGADRGPPGWKKGGREYSSDEDGDGPGGEPLEIVYQELTLGVILRVRIYTQCRRVRLQEDYFYQCDLEHVRMRTRRLHAVELDAAEEGEDSDSDWESDMTDARIELYDSYTRYWKASQRRQQMREREQEASN